MAIDGLMKGKQFTADTITAREVLTASPGATVNAGDSASEGSANELALADHQHAVSTASPSSTLDGATANAEGVATSLARSDHDHALDVGATPQDVGSVNAEGSDDTMARADHVHAIGSAAASGVLNSKNFAWGVQVADVVGASATTTASDAFTKSIMDASQTKKVDGNNTTDGIDTTAPVAGVTENKVEVRNATNGDPFEDSNNNEVFARLTDTITDIAEDLAWDGSTTVLTGDTGGAIVGEWIGLDADGAFFEVTTVNSNVSFIISNPGGLTIPTGSGASASQKVDLTLSYLTDVTGTETAFTHDGTTHDLVFVESLGVDEAPYQSILAGVAFHEVLPITHTHDDRYFTESEIGAVGSGNPNSTSGASLVGTDASAIGPNSGSTDTTQGVLEAHETAIAAIVSAGTANAEDITTEAITGTDTALADQLVNTPSDNDTLQLFLNGKYQVQDALPGSDANEGSYSVSGQVITWLASTGLAVDLTTDDQLIAHYRS